MRSCRLALVLCLGACASAPKPEKQSAELFQPAVRPEPLTAEEVGALVQDAAPSIAACYHRERLSSDVLSSYVFELAIPNDSLPQSVAKISSSLEGQSFLEECVSEVLKRIKFPAHAGDDLKVRVPISPR